MKVKFFLGLFAVTLLAFNFSHSDNILSNDVNLVNIKLMQANAGEYNCDRSSENNCEIRGRKSSGVLTYYDLN